MLTKEERRKIFNRKKQKTNQEGKITPGFVNTTFKEFEEWFDEEIFEKGCVYCGTTNGHSQKIYELQRNGSRHDATRGGKRGKRLELDRVDPKQPYDNLQNVVWCCYWCNNAKSNFFTVDEFKPIATEIGKVLKKIN